MSEIGFQPTPWPTIPMPTEGQIKHLLSKPGGKKELIELLEKREQAIELEKNDPFRHGYEPQCWKDARQLLKEKQQVLILGGNRSMKTEFAAKTTVETLENREGRVVWNAQQNNANSIAWQQPRVYKYLPPEHRQLTKGRVANVSYTVKMGFSMGTFVLPNRSQCFFLNYEQNLTVIEGGEIDLAWCDELVPYDWIDTLPYRLVDRKGNLLITFTPKEGYTRVVQEFLAGARVVDARPTKLLPGDNQISGCPPGHMPYILQPRQSNRAVICFFTEWNPYLDFEDFKATLEGKTVREIKIRAYGWADKLVGNTFPKFGEVNLIPRTKVPEKGTNYLVADPGGAKSWFLTWVRVTPAGHWIIYREWPDISYGEWAEPGGEHSGRRQWDGKPGPAQQGGAGMGIKSLKKLILQLEGAVIRDGDWDYTDWEEIEERIIDPRAGAAQVPGMEDGTSIIDQMLDEHWDDETKTTLPAMDFIPAPSSRINEGIELINDLLDYNRDAPVSAMNCPRLYLASDCQQTEFSLREWTGQDGEKGASKDPIDNLRYAAKRELAYVDPDLIASKPGKGFG